MWQWSPCRLKRIRTVTKDSIRPNAPANSRTPARTLWGSTVFATAPHAAVDGSHAERRFRLSRVPGLLPTTHRTINRISLPCPSFHLRWTVCSGTAERWANTPQKRTSSGSTTSVPAAARLPSHVREMARALGKISNSEREWKSRNGKPMSAYEYYGHDK